MDRFVFRTREGSGVFVKGKPNQSIVSLFDETTERLESFYAARSADWNERPFIAEGFKPGIKSYSFKVYKGMPTYEFRDVFSILNEDGDPIGTTLEPSADHLLIDREVRETPVPLYATLNLKILEPNYKRQYDRRADYAISHFVLPIPNLLVYFNVKDGMPKIDEEKSMDERNDFLSFINEQLRDKQTTRIVHLRDAIDFL